MWWKLCLMSKNHSTILGFSIKKALCRSFYVFFHFPPALPSHDIGTLSVAILVRVHCSSNRMRPRRICRTAPKSWNVLKCSLGICGLFERWCGMASAITRFEHTSMWLLSVNLSLRKSFQILLSHLTSIKKLDYWRSEHQPRRCSDRVITSFRKSLQQTVDPDAILGTLFFNNDESKMVCVDDQF